MEASDTNEARPNQPGVSARAVDPGAPMKRATILDEVGGVFGLEYDNTIGRKHTMRLDAATYEDALLEARAFLEIGENDQDEAGDQWAVE
jgi:hypothetical protein